MLKQKKSQIKVAFFICCPNINRKKLIVIL